MIKNFSLYFKKVPPKCKEKNDEKKKNAKRKKMAGARAFFVPLRFRKAGKVRLVAYERLTGPRVIME